MSAPAPVEIPGFSFVRALGAGGFADVLLYRQEMPRREVAVKILRAPVDQRGARERFEREAGVMAALSTHPSIVTIHQAAIAQGDRAYLVMEYCSLPTLAARAEKRLLSVPELLQTMVRLSGAVETAHRAGILHRDIKPANVLTTDYGWPALTDFGIAGLADEAEVHGGSVSIPWSAPEAVAGRGWDRRSDVYSLAATAYTALTGASPFAAAPGTADVTKLMTRVLRDPVPATGRADVPASLERLLHAALSKSPAERPQTASDFARSLQSIEQEMHLSVTHLDILGDPAGRDGETDAAAADDAESTFLSGSRPPSPTRADQSSPAPGPEAPPADEATVLVRRDTVTLSDEATVLARRGSPQAGEATVRSPRGATAPGEAMPARATPTETDATILSPRPRTARDEDDATRLVRRSPAGAGDGASDVGDGAAPDAAASDDASDATVLAPGRREHADTPVPAAPSGRRAYSPGEAGVAGRVYGVRAASATAPPPRAQAAASAPSPPAAAAAPAKGSRRRGIPTFVIVGIGALAVTAGAAAALIALVTG